MRKALDKPAPQPAEAAAAAMDLGRWLGRREAFSLVAGSCSGAEIESLRHIKKERLYLNVAGTWEEFCDKHVGASRTHVEKSIRLLEEFGPAYFQVAQMAHIGPEEYRAIAAHVDAGGVRLAGAAIALLPENAGKVSAAVNELLSRAVPEKPAGKPDSFAQVLKRFESAAKFLDESKAWPDTRQKLEMASILWHMRVSAARKGIVIVGQ